MDNDQLFQAILNSISDGVMTVDKDWRILSWNLAAETITGFGRDEVIGKECSQIFRTPLCRDNCPVDRVLSCGHPYRDIEVMVRNKMNQAIHLLVNAAPLYDVDGSIIGGVETFRDVSQNRWLKHELQQHYGYTKIIGRSEPMQRVFEVLADLMKTDTTVLIQGESGTGKEVFARALHFYGPRKEKAFVAINCSAIPEGVLEAELFGHKKGAFTGAFSDRVGKFELASGGTLFLDEIAEISPAIQVKLLRVLEEREFQRIGDNKTIKVDVRIVAATNKELYQQMLKGAFREDLYYRLSVFPIDLPPLRERIEDIPLLVSHFIEKFNEQMGRRIQGIADRVLEILEAHHWPGNIRELSNAIEHAFVHCKKALIHPSDLPQTIINAAQSQASPTWTSSALECEAIEREQIIRALQAVDGKKSLAAKRLRMSRATLWRKMVKHGIQA